MSDERQQHHSTVAHNNNNINNNNKSVKDNNSNTTNTNAETTTQNPATTPRKSNIHEMRNQEFVSRLMAATPPYLYSAPVGPNNFFFSDMLRALVQARNNETARNLQLQQAALSRRPRKRVWSQPHRAYYEQHLRERKETEERQQLNNASQSEKPLELTTTKPYINSVHKYRKLDETVKELNLKQQAQNYASTKTTEATESLTPTTNTEGNNETTSTASTPTPNISGGGAIDVTQNNTPPAASLPPQDLVLPPPPPVWYPPLYPPYGIDPLHFFIDLRVSGHIYDRKKENVSPLTNGAENGVNNATSNNETETPSPTSITLPNKHRHGSAFTVPVPKALGLPNNTTDAINLSANTVANKFEHYAKYYDLGESKENQPNQPFLKNSYMLQHLPRLYSQFAARDLIGQHMEHNVLNSNNNNNNENTDNMDSKSEDADCDADSTDGRVSNDAVDVEIIDSIKYRNDGDGANDGDSSRCSSADDASITQID